MSGLDKIALRMVANSAAVLIAGQPHSQPVIQYGMFFLSLFPRRHGVLVC